MRRLRLSGLSLVEILIAMTVFISAFLALLSVFPQALHSIRQARETNLATFLAEQAIENIRAANYSTINVSVPPAPVNTVVNVTSNNQTTTQSYTTTVNYAAGPSGFGNSTVATVLVSWSSDRFRSTQLGTEVAAP